MNEIYCNIIKKSHVIIPACRVERETEKAYQLDFTERGDIYPKLFWVPKSQCYIGEVGDEFPAYKHYGEHIILSQFIVSRNRMWEVVNRA